MATAAAGRCSSHEEGLVPPVHQFAQLVVVAQICQYEMESMHEWFNHACPRGVTAVLIWGHSTNAPSHSYAHAPLYQPSVKPAYISARQDLPKLLPKDVQHVSRMVFGLSTLPSTSTYVSPGAAPCRWTVTMPSSAARSCRLLPCTLSTFPTRRTRLPMYCDMSSKLTRGAGAETSMPFIPLAIPQARDRLLCRFSSSASSAQLSSSISRKQFTHGIYVHSSPRCAFELCDSGAARHACSPCRLNPVPDPVIVICMLPSIHATGRLPCTFFASSGEHDSALSHAAVLVPCSVALFSV